MEARLLLGSDDAKSDSGHGYCKGKWLRASLEVRARLRQRKMDSGHEGGEAGQSRARRRRQWELQSTLGGGRMWSGLLANPSLV